MKKPSEISDYFERLGIDKGASQKEIKSETRKLLNQYHPDKNPGNEKESTRETVAILEAYKKLTSKEDFFDSFYQKTSSDIFSKEYINKIKETYEKYFGKHEFLFARNPQMIFMLGLVAKLSEESEEDKKKEIK